MIQPLNLVLFLISSVYCYKRILTDILQMCANIVTHLRRIFQEYANSDAAGGICRLGVPEFEQRAKS